MVLDLPSFEDTYNLIWFSLSQDKFDTKVVSGRRYAIKKSCPYNWKTFIETALLKWISAVSHNCFRHDCNVYVDANCNLCQTRWFLLFKVRSVTSANYWLLHFFSALLLLLTASVLLDLDSLLMTWGLLFSCEFWAWSFVGFVHARNVDTIFSLLSKWICKKRWLTTVTCGKRHLKKQSIDYYMSSTYSGR